MANAYYSLQLQTQGSFSGAAYFFVSVAGSAAQFDGAGITIYPSAAQATFFTYQNTAVEFQAPAGRMTGGITVVTPDQQVVGTLGASPALDVPTTLTIYGAANQLGSVTLPAGQTSIPFHFDLPSGSGFNQDDAKTLLAKVAGKPE